MLLRLLTEGRVLDEVVFYDTGMEFRAIYDIRDRILPILKERGITYTELHPEYDFEWKMFDKPVNGKNGFHYGYSWCGGRCRWGTRDKIIAVNKYFSKEDANAIQYVGIAADESHRFEKEKRENKILPLVEWGMTESDCLEYCREHGYDWIEQTRNGPVRLYDILDRVSCWCCSNKNLKELRNIYRYLPEYWAELERLQSKTSRPMKGEGKSVFELRERFRKMEYAEK